MGYENVEQALRKRCVSLGHIEVDPIAVVVEGWPERQCRLSDIDRVLAGLPDDPQAATNEVYFVVGAELVKIGTAGCAEARLRSLQSGSPVPLELLATMRGGFVTERYLHDVFADSRRQGEWFDVSALLLSLIIRLVQRTER